MFGVHIKFKDGTSDWIDPVSEDPTEIDGILTINNSSNSYDYELSKVDTWEKYRLCNKCLFDLTKYDCTDYQCLNPKFS